MSCGLRIHKQAILIEYYLNQAVNKLKGQRYSELADITMVYKQPIRLMAEILSDIQSSVKNDAELQSIQDIKKKYCVYQGYILTQLDETVCAELVNDLKELSE